MPSPILEGRPLPLPIPAGRWPGAVTYADVGLGPLVERLSKGRLAAATRCHLDPDIVRDRLPREPGWRGAFGQCGAAQGHLERCGVGPGDLFLFFGLYRDAAEDAGDCLHFRGPRRHLIYGWLQVAEVMRRGDRLPGWLAYHPHASGDWPTNNTVYVARERLSFADLPGYGVLTAGHLLTAEGAAGPSLWRVPAWLDPTAGGVGMTFQRPEWWVGDGLLRASGRGQEFVADIGERRDALEGATGTLRAGGA
jgi:hypothetical protein